MTGNWKHLFFSVLDAGLYNPGVTGGFLQGRQGRVCLSFWCHGRPWLSRLADAAPSSHSLLPVHFLHQISLPFFLNLSSH